MEQQAEVGVGQIRVEEDPKKFKADASAKEEKRKFGDHSLDDADDNYAIRKAIKEQCQAHACLMFRCVLGFVGFIALSVLALIAIYICSIWSQIDKVEAILSHVFTHSLALIAGLLIKAVFGARRENGN